MARGTATAAVGPVVPLGCRAGESPAFGQAGAAGTCRIWDFFRREKCAGTAKATWAPPFQKRSYRGTAKEGRKVGRVLGCANE